MAADTEPSQAGTGMPAPALASPAAMRAYIVERMVGETGTPEEVATAAQGMGRRLAPIFARAASAALPVPIEVAFAEAVAIRLGEAHPVEPGAAMVRVPFRAENGLIALDPAALGQIVGVMFGAEPTARPTPLDREPSTIECDVAGMLLKAIAEGLAEAADPAPVLPLPDLLWGTALAREPRRDVAAVVLRFRLGGPEGGTLSFALPQRLVLRPDRPPAPETSDWGGQIGEELMRSSVPLSATLVLGRLTLGALDALELGTVVPFEAGAPQTARLSSRGRPLFSGEFGQIEGRYSILLGDPFDAAQDLMDTLVAAR